MNFLKNLFKKQPIVQETLNLGKITATIHFKNGQTLEKTFEGRYDFSAEIGLFEQAWFDHYTTAEELYQDFLADTQFVEFDEKTLIPVSEIAKIITEKQDHFVETKRQKILTT